MAIKSHIQAPKNILSRFVNEDLKKLYYLDVKTGKIGLCGSKKIGQELGWYSDEMESKLNKNVETPLSGVCNRILKFMKGKVDSLDVSPEDVEIIGRYYVTSIGRSACIGESFAEHFYVRILETQMKHDLIVNLSLNVAKTDQSMISELQWGLFDNRTETNFILPRNCFYIVTDDEKTEEIIAMPISPRVAIGLFTESYCDKHPAFREERIVMVQDDETLMYMNSRAFQYEVVMNGTFLVSPFEKELKDVWCTEKDKVEKLNILRKQLLENMK